MMKEIHTMTVKKKLLVFLGSPRMESNSALLANEAIRGAEETGAEVEVFKLSEMDMHPCQGCKICRKMKDRVLCAINDDMNMMYQKILEADAMLFATPIYFYTMSAQTKMFIDRFYAFGGDGGYKNRGKKIGVVASYGGSDAFSSGAVNAFRTFEDAFKYMKCDVVGFAHGSAKEIGQIVEDTKAMGKAYQLGIKLVEA